MILEFSIKNYLSFRDNVVLSFEATNDQWLESSHVVEIAPGVRVNKLGIVYGANASGKSNLILAINYLIRFWHNKPNNKTDNTQAVPFLLDESSRKLPSQFSLVFYAEKIKHYYELEITPEKVIREKLVYYPGTQPAMVFSRVFENNVSKIEFGSTIKTSSAAKDEMAVKCLPNMSVFAAYLAVNVSIPEMNRVTSWIDGQLMRVIEPHSVLTSYVEQKMMENSTIKSFVLNFLKEADYNISDITTKKETKKVSDTFVKLVADMDIPEEEKIRLKNQGTIETTLTVFTHQVANKANQLEEHKLPESLQSQGTIRTMGIAGVLSQAVAQNAFLAIDEIESSLHPRLFEFIIERFITLSDKAQLLLTTHYDGLLEEKDLLRKDNIWFTEKGKDGSTKLYSLSDFQGLGRLSSIHKAYKFGKFGAVPNI
jgi:AAA15 family ATPase/GTPase